MKLENLTLSVNVDTWVINDAGGKCKSSCELPCGSKEGPATRRARHWNLESTSRRQEIPACGWKTNYSFIFPDP